MNQYQILVDNAELAELLCGTIRNVISLENERAWNVGGQPYSLIRTLFIYENGSLTYSEGVEHTRTDFIQLDYRLRGM